MLEKKLKFRNHRVPEFFLVRYRRTYVLNKLLYCIDFLILNSEKEMGLKYLNAPNKNNPVNLQNFLFDLAIHIRLTSYHTVKSFICKQSQI